MCAVDKDDWRASKNVTTIMAKNGIDQYLFTRLLTMTLMNSQIIYNWSNEENHTQAQKRIHIHLEEQLANTT